MEKDIEMKYLQKVADYLISEGFEVEEPKEDYTDILDVWGKIGKRKCFKELSVFIYKVHNGVNGVWSYDGESVEVFLNDFDDLVGESSLYWLLTNLKPLKK